MEALEISAEELESIARQPSMLLQVYRLVAGGAQVEFGDQWVVDLKRVNPRQFMLDLSRMEREWREQVGKLERPAEAQVEALEPGECLRVAERWLLENGVVDAD